MQVDSSVDEADVGGVKVGQAASFTVDAWAECFRAPCSNCQFAPGRAKRGDL